MGGIPSTYRGFTVVSPTSGYVGVPLSSGQTLMVGHTCFLLTRHIDMEIWGHVIIHVYPHLCSLSPDCCWLKPHFGWLNYHVFKLDGCWSCWSVSEAACFQRHRDFEQRSEWSEFVWKLWENSSPLVNHISSCSFSFPIIWWFGWPFQSGFCLFVDIHPFVMGWSQLAMNVFHSRFACDEAWLCWRVACWNRRELLDVWWCLGDFWGCGLS